MDENYHEESVAMCDETYARGKTKNTMAGVIFWASGIFGVLGLFLSLAFQMWIMLIPTVLCAVLFFFFRMKRDKYVFDCDYILVDGSFRIAKIMNSKHRKALAVVECAELESLGKYDSDKCKSYSEMPGIKKIIATPNIGAHDDKIYYCYYTADGQKSILYFEPSNVLLLNISKACKKNIFNV